MLKKGDKLLCKKRTNGLSEFIINEYYQVMQISTQSLTIKCGSSFPWLFYFHTNNKLINDKNFKYLWDYFYKPQEVRQLKLKQLSC